MEASGRHPQLPLELGSSDEDENPLQQVHFVTDPDDDYELFAMARSKKPSWDIKRKRDLLKAFSVKNPRHIFDKSFSERADVQELYVLCSNTILCLSNPNLYLSLRGESGNQLMTCERKRE